MKKEKVILILGAGVMQIPAIRIAKSMNWKVIVADGNPQAEGRGLADHYEVMDLKNLKGLLGIALRYRDSKGLDGVFTAGTDFSTSVAYLAESLKLPGIPYDTALKATDKFRMRQCFREHGVPCPAFQELTYNSDIFGVLKTLRFPLVIKPVDNMGARGVRRVDTEDELVQAFDSAIKLSRTSRVIAEEYIEGPELSLDALVYNGTITVCGIADRQIYFEPYFVELGHILPTNLPDPAIRQAVLIFKAGIKALGITCGAAKGDLKIPANGPVVGEIAARLSGGYMSGWTFPYSSGVEVTRSALRIAAGLPPDNLTPLYARTSCERAFISIPGVVKGIRGFDAVKGRPGLKESFLRVAPGSSVVFPRNNVEKCGNVITCADTRSEAVQSAFKAINEITISLKEDNEETESFIFSGQGPFAFALLEPANQEAYEAMPPYLLGDGTEHRQVSVLPFPRLIGETSLNWHGNALRDEMERFIRESGISFLGSGASVVLGRIFWKAFLKGGIQAGLYLSDTVRLDLRKGLDPSYRLEKWKKSAGF